LAAPIATTFCEEAMPAIKLQQHRVAKPWGRRRLFPGFPDVAPGGEPIGEIWFQQPGDTTPDLLIKYLFTGERLSVQVHPDDEQARARGLPRGKDECWTILAADPDSTIALGPRQAMDRDTLRAHARDGRIEDDLDWKPVAAGDFFYAPSGTVHAIGAGLTLIEVQQNSETTYRLYDYGSDRDLHLEDGAAVAHLEPYRPITSPGDAGEGRAILVEGPKFVLERCGGGERQVVLAQGTTAWLVPITGSGSVADLDWRAGECLTLTGTEIVVASADADYLLAYPGTRRL
jgi:mannose-6-phosphate isomerase